MAIKAESISEDMEKVSQSFDMENSISQMRMEWQQIACWVINDEVAVIDFRRYVILTKEYLFSFAE